MCNNELMKISNVSAGYGKAPVIDNVSLSITEGSFFGLIGLNGEGKTTLIKCILGLREPSSGSIKINGYDAGSLKAKEQIAYLPERFDPPWFLSGIEFIQLSLKLYKQPFVLSRVIEFAHKFALSEEALKRRVSTYSKGMRQKLGLLATVMTNCSLLILDEPMSGLDPRARRLVKDCLLDVQKEGRTVFLSSHILADLDEICTEICILDSHHLRFIGTPEMLREASCVENLEQAFLNYIESPRSM